MAKVEAPSGIQSRPGIQIRGGIAEIGVWLGESQGGGRLRSKGEVSEARVATVTSEVAHPGGKKAAGAWHGRGDSAKAGRRPLHDELGGHWQQIPGQTDKNEGRRD